MRRRGRSASAVEAGMLDWVKKLVGGDGKVPDGVPEEWIRSVEALLAAGEAKGARAGIGAEVLSYILTGHSVAVLADVTRESNLGAVLGGFMTRVSDALPDVYSAFGGVDPRVALRWARVVDASGKSSAHARPLRLPDGGTWPDALLKASANVEMRYGQCIATQPRGLRAAQLEAMLVEDRQDPAAPIVAAFSVTHGRYTGTPVQCVLLTMIDGYADMLDRHVEAIRPLIVAKGPEQQLHVLSMLDGAHPRTLEALGPQLAALASCGNKQVRASAQALLATCGEPILGSLKLVATNGSPNERAHALRAIGFEGQRREREDWIALAREMALADKAVSVRSVAAELAPTDASHDGADSALEVELPIVDWSAAANRVDPAALQALCLDIANAATGRSRVSDDHRDSIVRHLLAALERGLSWDRVGVSAPEPLDVNPYDRGRFIGQLGTSDATPVAIVRVASSLHAFEEGRGTVPWVLVQAFNASHRRTGRPTLLELEVVLGACGVKPEALLRACCRSSYGVALAADWPAKDVWPFLARHVDELIAVMTQPGDYAHDPLAPYRLAATLPALPSRLSQILFATAVGPSKSLRGAAQTALHTVARTDPRIVNALADGKAETREVAARWLGRLKREDAIPALEKALEKEKDDVAKSAMFDALEALGRPVEKYLGRDALLKEARKPSGKPMKDLDWFPWEALPGVRWAADGAPVEHEILKYLLTQAVKQKSTEPNAVLRRICSLFDARDREALGQFVLESWIHHDLIPIPEADARAQASQNARFLHQHMASHPQYYEGHPQLGASFEQIEASMLPALLRQPTGSAIGSKGLLAVAGACCAERAAPTAQRYLKEWYGMRAAQGKALIGMLAWIEHPSATQLMLSVGNRFRTKGFQEEATRQAEALARRKGWTLAELSDRTIPTAGFDDDGVLELTYGARTFTARLLPDLSIELSNPEGKKIASLPDPRQDDDAEAAKASKKTLSAAKKELKTIVTLQSDRLYEALCTEREWSAADWNALRQHPVMRHLMTRLVWAQVADNRVVATLRPLEDGTLTTVTDDPMTLADDARVRLAHDTLLAADDVAAWGRHLIDYEVKPPFQQLGKGQHALPEDQAQADEIKDFEGHLLEAFSLRGRATKLGWVRGETQDAGWFYTYEKRFPTLGMSASIEFTGNPLPEQNRLVALVGLSLQSSGNKMALASVPKVLLAECWNDMRLMAADGSGFDPDWRKKSEFT